VWFLRVRGDAPTLDIARAAGLLVRCAGLIQVVEPLRSSYRCRAGLRMPTFGSTE
jgi:hypothetical protein